MSIQSHLKCLDRVEGEAKMSCQSIAGTGGYNPHSDIAATQSRGHFIHRTIPADYNNCIHAAAGYSLFCKPAGIATSTRKEQLIFHLEFIETSNYEVSKTILARCPGDWICYGEKSTFHCSVSEIIYLSRGPNYS